jgi:hypothetical protein
VKQLPFRNDFAIEEMDLPLGMRSKARIMRDHADRRTLFVKFLQQMHYRLAILRVEVSGWLIRQQNRR